jgi:hypothetical protein
VLPAALKKTMPHHALSEQKQNAYQDNDKQKPSDFAP